MYVVVLLCWFSAADLLAPVPAEKGRIFTGTAGGTITAKAPEGNATAVLKDGELVSVESSGGEAEGGDAVAVIRVGKRTMLIPNANLLIESDLVRSPDKKWAIWHPVDACGDLCHAQGWLLGPGVRKKFSDDLAPDLRVAWRADGREVAAGASASLALIELPAGKVDASTGFSSPAYAPDGRLFVRGPDGGDAVFEWVRGGKPRQVLAMRGQPPAMEEGEYVRDVPPPTFDEGRLFAEFQRKRGSEYRNVLLSELGKDTAGSAAPPAVEQAMAAIVGDALAPAAAAKRAVEEGKANPAFAHPLATSANTRGYRLWQAKKAEEALPLFEAAAALDPKYGMPRYNAARVLAEKGDAAGCARWLGQLKALGPGQRSRVEQARKDAAFAKVIDSAEVKAVFEPRKP